MTKCCKCGTEDPAPCEVFDEEENVTLAHWFIISSLQPKDPTTLMISELGELSPAFKCSIDKEIELQEGEEAICPDCMPTPEELNEEDFQ